MELQDGRVVTFKDEVVPLEEDEVVPLEEDEVVPLEEDEVVPFEEDEVVPLEEDEVVTIYDAKSARKNYQIQKYPERAAQQKEYSKTWRASERGKAITAKHHEKAGLGIVQLTHSALVRGYTVDLLAAQVDALVRMLCAYCGVPNCGGIDRVVNTDNYTLENSVPACTICNHMKSDDLLDDFLAHRARIAQFQETHIVVPASPDGTSVRYFSSYVKSASIRGVEWSLSSSDFLSLTRAGASCFYCGDSVNFMGIDRKNNDVGYMLENLVSCCKKCNYLKWNLSVQEFVDKCRQGVLWMALHPLSQTRSQILQKMPSVEQMAATVAVQPTQDKRKTRKLPPVIAPEDPVYFLVDWKIKRFHLYLDCGGGRVEKNGVRWQDFATHTIPLRLVPVPVGDDKKKIELCGSCANARPETHTPTPAVTFETDAAALEWLNKASSDFSRGRVTVEAAAADVPADISKDALRKRNARAAETDEQREQRQLRDANAKRIKRAT
jgi:hypothetical protein